MFNMKDYYNKLNEKELNENKIKKVILSGGGTGGSVTPLLAVAKTLRQKSPAIKIIFVGTKTGPEKELLSSFKLPGETISFLTIPAGKLRRYFSVQNITDIYQIIKAFFVSLKLLQKEKPDLIFSAGGFVSVPLAYAAYLKNIPVIIHQQDVRPGLANRLMAKVARNISTTFEKSLTDYGARAVCLGNPAPEKLSQDSVDVVKEKYSLVNDKPILLITGGGTGSSLINQLSYQSIATLEREFQIMHLTGKGKAPNSSELALIENHSDYHWREIISSQDLFALMQASSLVVSRCGLGTLTELAVLNKPAILIPIFKSHQEDNANVFQKSNAAIVLEQNKIDVEIFSQTIINLFSDKAKMTELSDNISRIIKPGADESLANLILEVIEKKDKN